MNKSCIQKLSVRASHQFRCSSWTRAFLNWSYMWHVGKVRIHIRYVTYRIYRNLYTSRFWWICRFAVSSFACYMCRCHGWWLDLITEFHHTIGRFEISGRIFQSRVRRAARVRIRVRICVRNDTKISSSCPSLFRTPICDSKGKPPQKFVDEYSLDVLDMVHVFAGQYNSQHLNGYPSNKSSSLP